MLWLLRHCSILLSLQQYLSAVALCGTSNRKLSKLPLSTTFSTQPTIYLNECMNITALLVHFMKFMCTSFPACEWTTKRWADEQIDEERTGDGGGKMFILYAMWKFICASNDWVIICGTFILSTENKSFLICCFFWLQFSILCLVCACVEVDCLFFQSISISIIFNSPLSECAKKMLCVFC